VKDIFIGIHPHDYIKQRADNILIVKCDTFGKFLLCSHVEY